MTERRTMTVDGNEAAASVAHRVSEVIAIYPITPSSAMGELSDEWSNQGRRNLWGNIPDVVEMQSEAGAAGAVHGALQAGALSTTFTASQGLLLMIPNMFKIAGELTPFTMHVAARTIATHALSIFGDHSDVMACRTTGFAMLSASSVQEAHDFAAIAHAATLDSRVPFMHFFDGFRTSHEVSKIEELTDDDLRALLSEDQVAAHRRRALTPDHPVLRGTAQNPDTFFQAREAANLFYRACPDIVEQLMARFAALTGRRYGLFEYAGHPEAERVVVIMGSGAETVHETVDDLTASGDKVGVLKVHLFRPFSIAAFLRELPRSVRAIAVMDRTKEPGALGEPLYQDVVTALAEARADGTSSFAAEPVVVGGRYGLSSKEFTPAMVKAIFDTLAEVRPKNHFTVGIMDDVTHTSLAYDDTFDTEPADVTTALFYGLGADGTVGANKNSIKIIGEETDLHVQGYFVYDSKKAGATTVSHLRTSPRPIRSAYLISKARFVACHQFEFLERVDVLEHAVEGAVFLLNAPYAADEVWERLPREVQEQLIDKRIRFYTIDAAAVMSRNAGAYGISSAMCARTMPSKSASARIPSAGPSLGAKFAGHVETMRSTAGSNCHFTRAATASPATRRNAVTISPTPTRMPGTFTERVCANAEAGTSWPRIRLATTAPGEVTHIRVVGATGQSASTPARGSRMMPLANDEAARFGLPGTHDDCRQPASDRPSMNPLRVNQASGTRRSLFSCAVGGLRRRRGRIVEHLGQRAAECRHGARVDEPGGFRSVRAASSNSRVPSRFT